MRCFIKRKKTERRVETKSTNFQLACTIHGRGSQVFSGSADTYLYTKYVCIEIPSHPSRTIVVNRSVYMCTGYSRRGRARTEWAKKKRKKEKERKNPGRVKRYQSEGEGTRWRFVKRERHVQLNPYKAKLFIHYSLFILLFANEPKDF